MLNNAVRKFISAFAYLIGYKFDDSGEKIAAYKYDWAGWFPIVGFIFAVFAGLIAEGFLVIFPKAIAAFLTIITIYSLTRFISLRSIAKMMCEFYSIKKQDSNSDEESRLIWNAHSAETFAVLSSIFCKTLCLCEMPDELFAPAVATSIVVSRCWILTIIILVPARNEDSIIYGLQQNIKMLVLIFTGTFAVAASGLFAGFAGITTVWLSVIVIAIFGVFCTKKLGGTTQASVLSSGELTEIMCLLTFASAPVQQIVLKTGISFF